MWVDSPCVLQLHHARALGSTKPIAPITYMWRPLQEKDRYRAIGAEQHNVDATHYKLKNEWFFLLLGMAVVAYLSR